MYFYSQIEYKFAMNNTSFPQNLFTLIDFEIYVLLTTLGLACYLFYRFLLKDVSTERHQSLTRQFKNLLAHFITVSLLYLIYTFLFSAQEADISLFSKRLSVYSAVALYISASVYFVKTARLFVLQYLFLGSMRAGVPLLLVNIFSLILSVVISFWSLSHFFNIQLTSIVATSAAFSIILGLALQDTLGNLFAGISLQIDRTFEIGDWLEIQNGTIKITGQVKELSWRSTLLIGFSDEMIVIPNKLMAACQISNFSPDNQPIIRSQVFRIDHRANADAAKKIIESTILKIPEVRAIPEPFAFIQEVNENWIAIKVIYYLDQFGKQFTAGDKVLEAGVKALMAAEIQLAHSIIEIKKG